MRLSQRTERTEFESFVSVYEPLINNWSNVPTAQTPIFVLFLSAGVLFDGAFSLWVSLRTHSDGHIKDDKTNIFFYKSRCCKCSFEIKLWHNIERSYLSQHFIERSNVS